MKGKRSREELLIHVLMEHFASFFTELYETRRFEEYRFHESYLIPLEVFFIATLYPSQLNELKLKISDRKITSEVLETINQSLFSGGYISRDPTATNKLLIMPLNLAEKQLFPRLEAEKVNHYLSTLLKSCLSYQYMLEVIYPVTAKGKHEKYQQEQEQFNYLLNYLMIIAVVYTHNYQRRNIKGPAILELNDLTMNEILLGFDRLTHSLDDFYESELAELFAKKYFLAQAIIIQHFKISESKFSSQSNSAIENPETGHRDDESVFQLLNSVYN